MKILLIGSGGREHAIARKLAQSPRLSQLYIAPGNPGTTEFGKNVPIFDSNIQELAQFARDNQIDLTIVGPEIPLVKGIVDLFEQKGLPIIGPTQQGAQLEGSKEWAKQFMQKYNIPTASFQSFTQCSDAFNYIQKQNTFPIVIKADGLAAGKGVSISHNLEAAKLALENCFVHHSFGESGKKVVIESFLLGEEASVLAFTDGKTVLPMTSAQDHKALLDQDLGPNTGGMGAYSPAPIVTPEVETQVYEQILLPLIHGLQKEGIRYKGIIYAGLMIHDNTPSIVEFNVRFGDPETQVVLPRLKTDLIDIFCAIRDESLNQVQLEWDDTASVCVVLASHGYPGNYEKNKLITGMDNIRQTPNVQIIHAGTTTNNQGQILTNGGRVLGVVGQADTLSKTIDLTYSAVSKIHFENKYCRSDIGQKALQLT